VALLTRHGKAGVIAPVLDAAVGLRVRLDDGYDTDRLGTFCREVPRRNTQLDTARAKARIGMARTGLPLGLASEGAFGADPYAGLFPWNVELIVLLDSRFDLEVVGVAQGRACFEHRLCENWAALEAFAKQVGFPRQQLVLRPNGQDDPRLQKDIADWPALRAAHAVARGQSAAGRVFAETDGRAHANPTRMAMIRLATEDLSRRLRSRCPACGLPGYWQVERLPGLPCESCGLPTALPRAVVHGCLKCGYRQTRPVAGPDKAEAGCCDYCNP
jgi:hypothetical protein